MAMTTVWFITDIHGSDVCFRKFVNSIRSRKRPDVLIIGGDITGKHVVPIVGQRNAWVSNFEGRDVDLRTLAEVREYEKHLADRGAYGYRCDPERARSMFDNAEVHEKVVREVKLQRLQRWIDWADAKFVGKGVRAYVNPGNDDPWYVDELLDHSSSLMRPEGRVVAIDDKVTMISLGASNLTPWQCPRDFSENELRSRIESMAEQVPNMEHCLFNMHCPPYGTALDRAVAVDDALRAQMTPFGPEEVFVGSKAVRDAIELYQPCAGLHGHVHEQHGYVRIGRTLCFNPGSEYAHGRLRGVLLRFDGGRLVGYGLTREDAVISQ